MFIPLLQVASSGDEIEGVSAGDAGYRASRKEVLGVGFEGGRIFEGVTESHQQRRLARAECNGERVETHIPICVDYKETA